MKSRFESYSITTVALCEMLRSDPNKGLSDEEVSERLIEYGFNELAKVEADPWWKFFFRQLATPMVYLLSFAAFLSFTMHEWLDGGAIVIVILINTLIGFITEYRAEKALQALKLMVSPQSRVIRMGNDFVVPARQLVPGDIILLEPGDIVPADARLLEVHNLSVDESALTGESLPIEKILEDLPVKTLLPDRKNCVFSGTAIVRGTGRALIFATGMETEIGHIGRMLKEVSGQTTPLEERLARFSRFLIFLTIGIAIFVILLGLSQGRGILAMLETGIALAVAAVPEGLPFVATMTLALGVHRMAKSNALVRNLSAVETLGSTTVICTDKTGTLTMNDMTVREVVPATDADLHKLLQVAVLCNDAGMVDEERYVGDPMEVALLKYAKKRGIDTASYRQTYPVLNKEPFDSSTMRMITWHRNGISLKGAPERVLSLCRRSANRDLDTPERNIWLQKIHDLASRGMRTIAFAHGLSLEEMTFLGVTGIDDPPRPEVSESIHRCHDAGIHVVMITGDHKVTAESIASEIGIANAFHKQAISGTELNDLSEAEIASLDRDIVVIARVAPEHKLKIVRGLQQAGEVVAMTGDGVNDAVALKQADVGIAMGIQGTEVSKEASDIILQDDRFTTIVEAIAEGRRIFDNIRKSILFLLCCNLSEVLTVLLGIVLRLPSILLPLQILWINLATDVIPALSLAFDPSEPGVMERSPKSRDENILTRQHKMLIITYGIMMTVGVLGVYAWAFFIESGDAARATEMAFHTLVISQLFFIFNLREKSLLRQISQLWSNGWLLLGVMLSISLQMLITYLPIFQQVLDIVPLVLEEWSVVFIGALLPTLLAQTRKVIQGV